MPTSRPNHIGYLANQILELNPKSIKTKCACGCGKDIFPNKTYISNRPYTKYVSGHNRRGTHPIYPLDRGRHISEAKRGIPQSAENIEKNRMARLKQWKDPGYIRNQMKARNRTHINKEETKLLVILNNLFPNEWKWVGGGEVILGGRCPDFINCNGQKKLIEYFGDYWHKNDNAENKIRHFSDYGYKTLVIWGKELKNEELLKERIKQYASQ